MRRQSALDEADVMKFDNKNLLFLEIVLRTSVLQCSVSSLSAHNLSSDVTETIHCTILIDGIN